MPSSTSAQSLTLSFRFDDSTPGNPDLNPAAHFAALATTRTITAASSSQTYTIDVFATVTGTGGTPQGNLGLQFIEYRGVSSSINKSAFSTGPGVGVQGNAAGYNDAGGANPPFAIGGAPPWGFWNAANDPSGNGTGWTSSASGTIGDFGSTTNGTTSSSTADGIIDFGGPANNSNSSSLASVTGGTSYVTANSFSSQYVAAFNAATDSTTFDLAQFTFKIGTVSSSGGTTSFMPTLPLLTQSAVLIATYRDTTGGGSAINATGQSPYTIDSAGVNWTVVNTPEPPSAFLLIVGGALLFGIAILRRRIRSRTSASDYG